MTEKSSSRRADLQLVVPCYNEQQVLPSTVVQLRNLLNQLVAEDLVDQSSSILFVDDGSQDDTWKLIREYSEQFDDVLGLRLARNAGHQYALLAGLANSKAELTISIDADLQDDLSVIPEMIRKSYKGSDVVYGIRSDRSTDSAFKRFTAERYYKLLSLLGVDVVHNHADFRLMNRSAVDRLLQFTESNLYLRGIVPLVGHKTDSVTYKRLERKAGETKYPTGRMIALAVNGITSFSVVPLRLIAALGLVVFLISFLMGLWVLHVRLFTDNAVPGWASSLLPIFFLGGVQLLSLGVIGEYIAKIFIESKRRPRYFVETTTRRNSKR